MKTSTAFRRRLALMLPLAAFLLACAAGVPEALAEAAEHGADHAAHGNPLSPEKLKDLFWRAVNFAALLIILVKFGGRPVVDFFKGRQEQIATELSDLGTKRDEAEAEYKKFAAKLADMEREMERVVSQAAVQAQQEKERILAEAERAAEDIKRQAEAAVRGELEAARRQLREEVAEEAAKMAEDLIRKNLTADDQTKIAEQYLERVGAAL